MMKKRLFTLLSVLWFGCATGVLAQTGESVPPTNATVVSPPARKLYIESFSSFMNRAALERELLKRPDFDKLNIVIVRDHKETDLLIQVYRKKWTTRFTLNVVHKASNALLASCQASSLGGEIEPDLAHCLLQQIVKVNGKIKP